MNLAVLHLWYSKAQTGLALTPTPKREEEETGGPCCLPEARAGLMGVHPMGVHFIGVYLISVHLIRIH
jgi:hypothetical protein